MSSELFNIKIILLLLVLWVRYHMKTNSTLREMGLGFKISHKKWKLPSVRDFVDWLMKEDRQRNATQVWQRLTKLQN